MHAGNYNRNVATNLANSVETTSSATSYYLQFQHLSLQFYTVLGHISRYNKQVPVFNGQIAPLTQNI